MGVPTCSLAFDPSLVPQHDEERSRIRLFSQSYTPSLSFSRVDQIPLAPRKHFQFGRMLYQSDTRYHC